MLDLLTPFLDHASPENAQHFSEGFLGLALGAIGKIFGGSSKNKEAKAAAEAATLNAQQIRERAAIETTLRERTGQREAGTISANAGANGLAGGGSSADILRESVRNTAFDLSTIKSQSELEADIRLKEAKGLKAAGKRSLISGFLDAGSFLLGG